MKLPVVNGTQKERCSGHQNVAQQFHDKTPGKAAFW
jgi:hypothetical protein